MKFSFNNVHLTINDELLIAKLLPNAKCEMPNAKCEMPNAKCEMLNTYGVYRGQHDNS